MLSFLEELRYYFLGQESPALVVLLELDLGFKIRFR